MTILNIISQTITIYIIFWISLKSTKTQVFGMPLMEVLGAFEAEKLIKQMCKHYCGTPCSLVFISMSV